MNVLHIDSSVLSDKSASRDLTRAVVEQFRRADAAPRVNYRDLATDAIEHLSPEILAAGYLPPEARSERQQREFTLTQDLIEEFLAADVVVVGAPMYNFSIPSQLKAWIDRVAAAGRTFKYTESGPVGLAGGKKVVIVSSRGGVYSPGSGLETLDHQESYLKAVFGFFGITDIEIVRAEGLSMPALREQGLQSAREQVEALFETA